MYSIDTSALVDAWVRRYPVGVYPGLWQRVDQLVEAGELIATEEVLHELARQDDDLLARARDRPQMFIEIDDAIQGVVTDLLAEYPRLLDTRRNRSGADPFVIGLARQNGFSVVTAEARTGKIDKPNIPDVCDVAGIRCITFLDLIREQGWVF